MIRSTRCSRRGMAVVTAVIAMVFFGMAALSALDAGADDLATAALRVETTRAIFAADSAGVVSLRCVSAGLSLPAAGDTLTLQNATAEFTSVPAAGKAGAVVIEGRSGRAVRRVRIELSAP